MEVEYNNTQNNNTDTFPVTWTNFYEGINMFNISTSNKVYNIDTYTFVDTEMFDVNYQ